MVRWIIYYGDGTKVSSYDATPFTAPRQGVQIIAQEDRETGRMYVTNYDNYGWHADPGLWVAHDNRSIDQYLDTEPSPVRLRGYWISNDNWATILTAAKADDTLAPKTAVKAFEVEAGLFDDQ